MPFLPPNQQRQSTEGKNTQMTKKTERTYDSQLQQISKQIRYDTRCYFNVRSKADMSQLNLPHGTNN